MDDNNVFCHYPDPMATPPVVCDGSPDSRAAAAGYPFAHRREHRVGERLDLAPLFEHLAHPPGRTSNMLFADYDTVGVGFVTGSHGVVGHAALRC